jgi:hypothetical protein
VALTEFLGDGLLPLDNNCCERQIRSLAIGRKNYLFAGSDAGAERAAIHYSLLRTAVLARIDTYAYLIKLLERLAAGWPQRRINELLPENHVPDIQPIGTTVAEPQPVAWRSNSPNPRSRFSWATWFHRGLRRASGELECRGGSISLTGSTPSSKLPPSSEF